MLMMLMICKENSPMYITIIAVYCIFHIGSYDVGLNPFGVNLIL